MRQTHHWAALVFMASMVGARGPRVLHGRVPQAARDQLADRGRRCLIGGIAAGFSGYSLPDDLLSGTGLRIIYSAVLSIPLVGTWLAFLLFGGEFPSAELLPRLFVMHILLIPRCCCRSLGAHLALVWHQTHTQFRRTGTTEDIVSPASRCGREFALKADRRWRS